MKFRHLFFLWLLGLCQTGLGHAETFTSPVRQATLLELYTSEGCSSCPPADRWLSGFVDDKRLWRELVPVAFHVDYWNYLGWEDRFSRPAFSQRQRNLARQGNVRSVYTPGLVRSGKEWRSWFFSKQLDALLGDKVGVLRVIVDTQTDEKLKVRARFEPSQPVSTPLELNVALLGFDMQTQVRAGENEGKQLRHDFVVLQHVNQQGVGAGQTTWELTIPQTSQAAPSLGIAAWVSRAGSLSPIQATGGFLP